MEKTEAKIWTALGIFQQACPAIKKDSEAGTKFKYKYGSLPMILEVIKPHLKTAGLSVAQPIIVGQTGTEFIRTIVAHGASGETIESDIILPDFKFDQMNAIQSKGSVITYLRRYSLMSILGIVAEDDDNDAQGSGNAPGRKPAASKPASQGGNAPAAKNVKSYLNPMENGKDNPSWKKAVKFLADGGTIEEIEKKYRIGKNNREKLLNDSLTYDDLPFDRQADEAAANVQDVEVIETEVKPDEPNQLFDSQGDFTQEDAGSAPY